MSECSGSRTKLAERRERLTAGGVSATEIARLQAPVGLQIGAITPYEIAISIWADMIRRPGLRLTRWSSNHGHIGQQYDDTVYSVGYLPQSRCKRVG